MHSRKKIYLAGPITGTDYNDSRYGWRQDFVKLLKDRGADHLECFSPMREKEFLEKEQCISGIADYDSLHGFGTPQGILTRDHNDVRNCDAMVACFLGAKIVSIGTCVEFGFAYAYRKPVIMVMESTVVIEHEPKRIKSTFCADELNKALQEGRQFTDVRRILRISNVVHYATELVPGETETVKNPHDHLFLRACAGYVVPTLTHAADIVQSLLTPGL